MPEILEPRLQSRAAKPRHHLGVEVIAIFKLIKGCLLFAVALGLLNSLDTDVSAVLTKWITLLGFDLHHRYIQDLLAKVNGFSDHQIKTFGEFSFCYAALLLTEGVGLWKEWRWAEYLTVIATSSFIPIEIYHLFKHVTPTKLIVFAINILIVVYLVITLRRERKARAA